MARKKAAPTFRSCLLFFCIVFVEHLRLLTGMRTADKHRGPETSYYNVRTVLCLCSLCGSKVWSLCLMHKASWSCVASFISFWIHICLLFSIKSAALFLATCPLFVTWRFVQGPRLIAQIVTFKMYLNKYKQPAVWQSTHFIKSLRLFVVFLIKM